MENIYCISGLGADERIFKKLKVKGVNFIYLPWVSFDKHDELPCYAQKMASQIPENNPTILGLSFGGMLATEIALQRKVKKVFLVSSIKGKHELPKISSVLKYLISIDAIPYGLFKKPNKILYERFGAETEEEKQMLAAIMKDTDPSFLAWAFKAILHWQNTIVPDNIVHIHGTKDKILQPAYVEATHWLRNGTHMMVYNRADEVSALISSHIQL
ncbi:MAG TPA: alpha/beta hydrolase [Flavipsychrobacter sp.]|nr:alpha/beta hydrolase [Flavipsychrobacter sp.]